MPLSCILSIAWHGNSVCHYCDATDFLPIEEILDGFLEKCPGIHLVKAFRRPCRIETSLLPFWFVWKEIAIGPLLPSFPSNQIQRAKLIWPMANSTWQIIIGLTWSPESFPSKGKENHVSLYQQGRSWDLPNASLKAKKSERWVFGKKGQFVLGKRRKQNQRKDPCEIDHKFLALYYFPAL